MNSDSIFHFRRDISPLRLRRQTTNHIRTGETRIHPGVSLGHLRSVWQQLTSILVLQNFLLHSGQPGLQLEVWNRHDGLQVLNAQESHESRHDQASHLSVRYLAFQRQMLRCSQWSCHVYEPFPTQLSKCYNKSITEHIATWTESAV